MRDTEPANTVNVETHTRQGSSGFGITARDDESQLIIRRSRFLVGGCAPAAFLLVARPQNAVDGKVTVRSSNPIPAEKRAMGHRIPTLFSRVVVVV